MIKSINIGANTFNVTRASAVNQKTLMTLIGAKIALNSATSQVAMIDLDFLAGSLLTLNEQTLDKVASIVLYKTVESGGDSLVTLEAWQYGMIEYFQLIAGAIQHNLSDFFLWLDAKNAELAQANSGPALNQ